ncbi:integrase/recombinase xerD homolog [Lithobates pipiens]
MQMLVLYFVARGLERGVSVSAMDRKLAGLAFWFKLHGYADFTKGFCIRQAMKGYRRARKRRDTRRPVTFGNLLDLVGRLGSICSSGFEASLFRAAFALAFFGAFRVSELVSPSRGLPGGILAQDVRMLGDRVEILLRRSKTDQVGRGVRVCLYRLEGSPLCPVQAVGEFLGVRPGGDGTLLVHADGSLLSRFQFVAVFRKCLTAAGLDSSQFASHSFRIGAATEAARCGLDEAAVRRIGRWESLRFRSYVRPELAVD